MAEPEAAGVALAVAPSLIALAEWLAEKGGPAWAIEIALTDSEQHPREFRVGWERGHAAGQAASNARAEGLANLLRDLLEPIEGRWVDENHRDQDALRIRRLLDLCSTGGCTNKRGPEEADGFCYECCNDGEWPDADTWSEERKARAALAGAAPGRGEG